MRKYLIILVVLPWVLGGCSRKQEVKPVTSESREAKAMLQGIWVDAEDGDVSFRAVGDTIFYPDSTSQPAYFRIIGDTLQIDDDKYPIVKQASHLFWFKNMNGDVVKLSKSEESADTLAFPTNKYEVLTVTEVLKRDTVVMLGGERYHCYVAINPTKYKVHKASYNNDGVEVDNIYYDNIIHVSVYQGKRQVFSRDFKKQMYVSYVPKGFLEQAILSNIVFDHADALGFHFHATLCVPDGASCYMVSTVISQKGETSMKLLEY